MNAREILIHFALKYNGEWDKIYNAIQSKEEISEVEQNELVAKLGNQKTITILDENYPEKLKQSYRPPFVLFYKGDLSLLNSEETKVATLSSKNPTDYTIKSIDKITSELTSEIVINGLAKGGDRKVLENVLNRGLKAICVLGCGIDYVYPKENQDLYEKVEQNGLLISEYPSLVEPHVSNFYNRNRIIASICDKVLGFQVNTHSGSLVLIEQVLNNGKDIYIVPQPIFEENISNNMLIREGACLVEKIDDLYE